MKAVSNEMVSVSGCAGCCASLQQFLVNLPDTLGSTTWVCCHIKLPGKLLELAGLKLM